MIWNAWIWYLTARQWMKMMDQKVILTFEHMKPVFSDWTELLKPLVINLDQNYQQTQPVSQNKQLIQTHCIKY